MVAPAGAVGVTAATAMAVMEVAVMQAAVAAMPAAVAAMPAAHAVMPVAHAATVVEHAADTAAAMRAVVHADTAAAVHAAALAVVMAAALAAADMRVVAAATAAADIGNSCGFSQKGPSASAGGPFSLICRSNYGDWQKASHAASRKCGTQFSDADSVDKHMIYL